MAARSVLTSRSHSTDGLDRRFFLQAMEGKLFMICPRDRCDIGEWSACAFCMTVGAPVNASLKAEVTMSCLVACEKLTL